MTYDAARALTRFITETMDSSRAPFVRSMSRAVHHDSLARVGIIVSNETAARRVVFYAIPSSGRIGSRDRGLATCSRGR